MSKLQTSSSGIARAARSGNPEAESQARRNHAFTTIEVAIERALAKAPPLSQAQIRSLSTLLRGAK